ncbi:MAG TPA: TraK family protein [Acetobacteraceae bacterium]|nr:TraK family protein [Acetobacteraceae bacterium]
MSAPAPPKRIKGLGRVAFLAQRADIAADLDAGWPLTAIYARRAGKLGISYAQFARYVDQHIRRSDHTRTTDRGSTPAPPPLPAPVPPADPKGTLHAGHQPARRSFNHDPIERPDDRRRLLGED